MRRRQLLALAAAMGIGAMVLSRRSPPPSASPSLQALLGADAPDQDRYLRVTAPRAFDFPADHGPHPGFRHEWWYFTGHLRDHAGREYGFQLTFFRYAFATEATLAGSRWAVDTVWMGHFAISDFQTGEFLPAQYLQRPVLELAGARSAPPRVWIRDWYADYRPEPVAAWRIGAAHGDNGLELDLVPAKRYLPQGEDGYSRKGGEVGNASLYYSGTRLDARGQLRRRGATRAVAGEVWLDREWGSGALGEDVAGWDWFGLQLDDGSELMVYRLRLANGRDSSFSAGSLHLSDRVVQHVTASDINLEVLAHWTSPNSGVRYPGAWRLEIPPLALVLRITTPLPDQEWNSLVRYWEGAVRVEGSRAAQAVHGRGYAELTGY